MNYHKNLIIGYFLYYLNGFKVCHQIHGRLSVTAYVFKLADLCGRFKIVDRFIYFSLSYVVTDLLKSSVFKVLFNLRTQYRDGKHTLYIYI